ncbi:MAG: alpha/beta hydrolase [Dehalococcoidia bacterium]
MYDLFVTANGLRLHLVEHGAGRPVLFVHGTGMVAQVWEPVIEALGPGYRALTLDRRGHGDSDKPEANYQWRDTAADIAGVIDALGIRGCPVVGHSSGGTPIFIAAAEQPDLFGPIVVVDPIIVSRRANPSFGNSMVDRTRKRRAAWASAQEMYDSLGAKPPFDTWVPDALWAYVRHGTRTLADGGVTLKCTPDLEARMYQHDGRTDVLDAIRRVRSPMLIVRAGRSDRVPRAIVEHAGDLNPRCTVLDLPNATHFAPMEQPEAVAALITRFLRGNPCRNDEDRALVARSSVAHSSRGRALHLELGRLDVLPRLAGPVLLRDLQHLERVLEGVGDAGAVRHEAGRQRAHGDRLEDRRLWRRR